MSSDLIERRRPDGRKPAQLRPPTIEFGPIKRADGSCRFSLGCSTVIVAIYGPQSENILSKQLLDRARVDVTARARTGMPGAAQRALEMVVAQHCDQWIDSVQFPRCMVSVVVQEQSADGSGLAVTLNAAWCALLDAGVPMRSTCCTISVGVTEADGLVLDPCLEEETCASALCCISVNCHSGAIVSSTPTQGALSEALYAAAVCYAQGAAKVLEQVIRQALAKHLEKLPRAGQ
mmetsp:Transcript_54834/g.120242  ORF Transcript_54834/g.120242 Transcript_54834/m.120242 type:complete len:234 (+) Transcript_54834:25-726(+)